MALTDIAAIRLKTGDRPSIIREVWEADGEASDIKLSFDHIVATPVPRVWADNVALIDGVDYTVNYDYGLITLTLTPVVNSQLEYEYYGVVFTDDEIQFLLDEADGNTTLAAALVLYAWAADDAKLAKRETLSGGGGIGTVTIDTSIRVREMRATADSYVKQYQTFEGAGAPAESITEIGWTSQTGRRLLAREILSGNG